MEHKTSIFDKPHYEYILGKKRATLKHTQNKTIPITISESIPSHSPKTTIAQNKYIPKTGTKTNDTNFNKYEIKHMTSVFKNKKFIEKTSLCKHDIINEIIYSPNRRYMVTSKIEYIGEKCEFKICPISYSHLISKKDNNINSNLRNGYTTSVVNTEDEFHELGIFPTYESISIYKIHWNLFQLI